MVICTGPPMISLLDAELDKPMNATDKQRNNKQAQRPLEIFEIC